MLYEFRRALGPQLWEQTVVEVSAEYDRSPRDDQTGSDHAPDSNTVTLFSGAIKEPLFMGNIKVNARDSMTTKGTWGATAPARTDFANELIVTNEHVASSVAKLLGVESPSRKPSLIEVTSTGVVSLMEAPKNVG